MTNISLQLSGFAFPELFSAGGLEKLDQAFLQELKKSNETLSRDLLYYRHNQRPFSSLEISELLLAVAPYLEDFIIHLFHIEKEAELKQTETLGQNPVSAFKKFFVLRRAKKQLQKVTETPFYEIHEWLMQQISDSPLKTNDLELAVSLLGTRYMADPEKYSVETEKLTQWCIHALKTPEAVALVKEWTSFRLPERIDYMHLVSEPPEFTPRDGFTLTDPGMTAREAQDEVNYCIYCHDHEGDFCSKGFPVKKGDPSLGLKKNPLGNILTGCPLDEKISEMHALKRDGFTIAALAMIMVDNPMCPATGHRICNDCMKACIYQKQDPVNIPQTETRILLDALHLPWGVEIYDLFTRWNPLRQKQWVMKSYNGLKIMIAGMGPAGFTLAHHMLMEGFAVLGFDGLKIEPLPEKYIHEPILSFADLKESLDSRLMAGFGGVAEYGITVRWDKNFLKLIYISLSRKPYFQAFGSTRFGGTIRVHDAIDLGFDHFTVAVGAGLPKALPIPGSLAPGMRQANDFLMALQLGNAAKNESLTNIQIRLPAVVIGGGLTGVDTATELQAYYITQVEKIVYRYETLCAAQGENNVRDKLDPASLEILNEFLSHGIEIRKEREMAKNEKRKPNFIKLIHAWGGVTIVYRKTMQESPAYIHNDEELRKALEQGIFYLEALTPISAELNAFGHVETLICKKRYKNPENTWETLDDEIRIPARAILVATGTQPNIAYEFEHRSTFHRQGVQYQHYEDVNGELIIPHGIEHCKDPNFGPFTSYQNNAFRVSLIGDTHPVFHGSVVKAIASGMRTYPKILDILKDKLNKKGDSQEYKNFREKMHALFTAKITDIQRLSDHVIELTVKAPITTKHFEPGHFYRLQNYETFSQRYDHTSLQMEPLALIAADVDKSKGLLKFIVIEQGASSKLVATFKVNDPVSLMGPTGVRDKVSHEKETVLIVGNELSIPLVSSYGKALRETGNRVIYLLHLEDKTKLYYQDHLKTVTDLFILTSEDPIKVLLSYANEIPLSDVDRIYVIHKSDALRRFQKARLTILKPYLLKEPRMYGSVYSTMQCMLKGVCAQCLQWQIDPETGKRTKAVFACSWQDQPLERIDFGNIDDRQIQNRLQETLSDMWVDYLFSTHEIPRI